MSETVQQQIDFIEVKVKEILQFIDTLKRTYCIEELPHAISSNNELKLLIEDNVDVSQNHENALVDIENFQLKNLHHIRNKIYLE